MTHSAGMDRETFASVFPFGFVASAEGTLEWVGGSLKKHLARREGAPLSDCVRIIRPLGFQGTMRWIDVFFLDVSCF